VIGSAPTNDGQVFSRPLRAPSRNNLVERGGSRRRLETRLRAGLPIRGVSLGRPGRREAEVVIETVGLIQICALFGLGNSTYDLDGHGYMGFPGHGPKVLELLPCASVCDLGVQ